MNLKIVGGVVAYLFLDSKKRASSDIFTANCSMRAERFSTASRC
jgi:hypothetical protein